MPDRGWYARIVPCANHVSRLRLATQINIQSIMQCSSRRHWSFLYEVTEVLKFDRQVHVVDDHIFRHL
jgi:hypothetical protein